MKIKIVIVVVIVALGAAAAYLIKRNSYREGGTVHVSGNIEVTSVEVSFRIPGRVKERLVTEGEAVGPGQVVARLESDDIDQEVAARSAEVETARAVLAELLAGSRSEEIAQAEAVLAATESEAGRLDKDYLRAKALYEREVVTRQQYDTASSARETSQARAREAHERLRLVRTGPRPETISQARGRLRAAEAGLALAHTKRDYANLKSPGTGMVLSKNVEPGEQVSAGTPVITVGDLTNVWVRAYIAESELGRVKLGQKARVKTDTWPGKSYEGAVTFIAPEAEFTPKNVQTQKERVKLVYRIKISVPNTQMELKPGMPADAEIVTK